MSSSGKLRSSRRSTGSMRLASGTVPIAARRRRAGIADRDGIRLDPHALLQGNLRQLRSRGGDLVTGQRVARIERQGSSWRVTSEPAKAGRHR